MGVFSLRFISRGRHYCYGGGKLRTTEVIVGGVPTTVVQDGYWDAPAQFGPPNMPPPTDPEVQFALKNLRFHGLPLTSEDSTEHVTPVFRLGVFDTKVAQDEHGWTDEQRELIEQRLLDSDDYGREYVLFAPPRAAKPWPRYDDLRVVGNRTPEKVADKIIEMVRELGLNADDVAEYERQNAGRDYVLAALAEIVPTIVVPDEIEVPA
jgi:hypothetical protein